MTVMGAWQVPPAEIGSEHPSSLQQAPSALQRARRMSHQVLGCLFLKRPRAEEAWTNHGSAWTQMRTEYARASSLGDAELSHLINVSWGEQGTHRSRFTPGPWGCGAAAWHVLGLCRSAAAGTWQGPCAQLSSSVNPF